VSLLPFFECPDAADTLQEQSFCRSQIMAQTSIELCVAWDPCVRCIFWVDSPLDNTYIQLVLIYDGAQRRGITCSGDIGKITAKRRKWSQQFKEWLHRGDEKCHPLRNFSAIRAHLLLKDSGNNWAQNRRYTQNDQIGPKWKKNGPRPKFCKEL
jgi:hypothetical protein